MIATIFIVSLALAWLGHETDWMRARLLVGASFVPIGYEHKSWEDILRDKPPTRYLPKFLTMQGYDPLCGWDWLENTMHVVPEYKFYLAIGGCRYNMQIKKSSILKDVMRVNKLTKKQMLTYI